MGSTCSTSVSWRSVAHWPSIEEIFSVFDVCVCLLSHFLQKLHKSGDEGKHACHGVSESCAKNNKSACHWKKILTRVRVKNLLFQTGRRVALTRTPCHLRATGVSLTDDLTRVRVAPLFLTRPLPCHFRFWHVSVCANGHCSVRHARAWHARLSCNLTKNSIRASIVQQAALLRCVNWERESRRINAWYIIPPNLPKTFTLIITSLILVRKRNP